MSKSIFFASNLNYTSFSDDIFSLSITKNMFNKASSILNVDLLNKDKNHLINEHIINFILSIVRFKSSKSQSDIVFGLNYNFFSCLVIAKVLKFEDCLLILKKFIEVFEHEHLFIPKLYGFELSTKNNEIESILSENNSLTLAQIKKESIILTGNIMDITKLMDKFSGFIIPEYNIFQSRYYIEAQKKLEAYINNYYFSFPKLTIINPHEGTSFTSSQQIKEYLSNIFLLH